MTPATRSVAVFGAVSIGGMSLVALALAAAGVGVDDPIAGVAVFVAMWSPTLGAVVASRWADGGWKRPFSLRRLGRPRTIVVAVPLLLPLLVYGVTYAVAGAAGWHEWDPAGGSGTRQAESQRTWRRVWPWASSSAPCPPWAKSWDGAVTSSRASTTSGRATAC